MADNRVLTSKQDVMGYIGTTREYVVDMLVQLGLPVVFINGRWWSSPDAITVWLREFFLQNRGQRIDAKPGQPMSPEIAILLQESVDGP
ncbi:MAG: hypothetical protein ACOWWM_09655 [Desulfobacterales bacterium]